MNSPTDSHEGSAALSAAGSAGGERMPPPLPLPASAPIEVRYQWTADAMLEGRRLYSRHYFGPRLRMVLPVLFALMLAGGLGGLIWGPESFRASCGFGLGAGLYWFLLRPWLHRLGLLRLFSKRPDKDIESRWSLDENHVVGSSALGTSNHAWAAFAKALFTPTALLLYFNDTMYVVMPRSGFQSEADFQSAGRLVKAKVPKMIEVN